MFFSVEKLRNDCEEIERINSSSCIIANMILYNRIKIEIISEMRCMAFTRISNHKQEVTKIKIRLNPNEEMRDL